MRKIRSHVKLIVAIVVIGWVLGETANILLHSELFGRYSLDRQLNAALSDTQLLKKISSDQATYQYLTSLPKGTKCANTSGFQGVMSGYDYYATTLGNKPVGVFMYEDDSNPLFTKWSVSFVRLQTDPDQLYPDPDKTTS